MNESTSWLLKRDRVEEATAIHRSIRRRGREDLVEAEVAAMIAAINKERLLKEKAQFVDICKTDRTLAASLLAPFTAVMALGECESRTRIPTHLRVVRLT